MKIIISNNDTQTMLKTIDSVLDKYGRDVVPENIKGQVTLSALKDMFERRHFDICKIRELASQNDVTISKEHMDLFQTLHCIDWNIMGVETREYVFALCIDYFRSNVVMAYAENI